MKEWSWFLFCVAILFLLLVLTQGMVRGGEPPGWEEDKRLTVNGDSSIAPSLCVADETIHVVWHDDRDDNYEIYYRMSEDNGDNWHSTKRLTEDEGQSDYADIAANGSTVHVVWRDDRDGNFEIYYKRSTDNGMTWGSDIRLTYADSYSNDPRVAVFGNNLHVVWMDSRDGYSEIYYKRSSDGGNTWSNDMRLTYDIDHDSKEPSIALNGTEIHVVWEDDRDKPGYHEIYYKKSANGGDSWTGDMRLTHDDGLSRNPRIAVNGSNIHVVWEDKREGEGWFDIYYKSSNDSGNGWSDDICIADEDSDSTASNIVVNRRGVHLCWMDSRDGNLEIYYTKSVDGGRNFGSDVRLTFSDDMSLTPSIAVKNDDIHVVWYDDRDGNYEIYYKRKPNLPPTVDSCDLSASFVPRNGILSIMVNGSDDNDAVSDLMLIIEYRPTGIGDWGASALSSPAWNAIDGVWEVHFTPDDDAETGMYDFRVRFQDSSGELGEWHWVTRAVEVRQELKASFSVIPLQVKTGWTVIFDGSGSTGKDLAYSFDFGDGKATGWTEVGVVNHSYAEKGLYNAKLKVLDGYSAESLWLIIEVKVIDHPKADISANRTVVDSGVSVQFDADNSAGESLLYYFEFGDGDSSGWIENSMIVHTYERTGTYTARVKVKDEFDDVSQWSHLSIKVNEMEEQDKENTPLDSQDDEGSEDDRSIEIGLIIIIIVLIAVITFQNKDRIK